jgi:hypothetical protein
MLKPNLRRNAGTIGQEDEENGDDEVDDAKPLKHTKEPQVLQLSTPRGIQHQPQQE